jgi:hypothetical protein
MHVVIDDFELNVRVRRWSAEGDEEAGGPRLPAQAILLVVIVAALAVARHALGIEPADLLRIIDVFRPGALGA